MTDKEAIVKILMHLYRKTTADGDPNNYEYFKGRAEAFYDLAAMIEHHGIQGYLEHLGLEEN